MVWQKEMNNGMEVDWFFKYSVAFFLLLVVTQIMAQNDKEYTKEKGLSVNTQSLFLFPYGDNIGGGIHKTLYDLEYDSRVYGVNTSVNYYFSPYLAAGLGIGYEKLTQPEISYYPIFFNLRSTLLDTKNTITTKGDLGLHMGSVDKPGFLIRWSLGYRTQLFMSLLGYFELIYSYQKIYKEFESSGRLNNNYGIESIGLSISIEIQ